MILHGLKLLLFPKRTWPRAVKSAPKSAGWLVAAALTAAVWPAAAVVAGHLGSALLGLVEMPLAVIRATVGFISVAGSALVMAPALLLLLLTVADAARANVTPSQTGPVAMCILWPTWFVGCVLAVPPLIGLGPEVGEIAWLAIAALVCLGLIRSSAAAALEIRRRWKDRFVVQSTLAFTLAFALVAIAPAMTVRSILGATTSIVPSQVERPALPRPPDPNW
ncbi:MAG: hypothetical protein QNJ97_15895 [Myxococcota bacterium]|nr:hypothetical protein [Myxococcota bacterium]